MRTLLTILLIACAGCDGVDKADTVTNTDATTQTVSPETPTVSPVRVIYLKKVKPLRFDPYDLMKPQLSGEILTCQTSFGGGCENHEFELVLTHLSVTERTIELRLTHNANGDGCEAMLMESSQFSLANAIQAFHDAAKQTSTDPITLRIFTDAGKTPAYTLSYKFSTKK